MPAQTGKAGVADKVKIAAFNAMSAKSLVLLTAVLVNGFRRGFFREGKLRIFRCVFDKALPVGFEHFHNVCRAFIALVDAFAVGIRQTFEQIGKRIVWRTVFVGGGVDVELFFGAGKGDIEQTQIFCRLFVGKVA